MPLKLERQLARHARKLRIRGRRRRAYIWGTLARIKHRKGR